MRAAPRSRPSRTDVPARRTAGRARSRSRGRSPARRSNIRTARALCLNSVSSTPQLASAITWLGSSASTCSKRSSASLWRNMERSSTPLLTSGSMKSGLSRMAVSKLASAASFRPSFCRQVPCRKCSGANAMPAATPRSAYRNARSISGLCKAITPSEYSAAALSGSSASTLSKSCAASSARPWPCSSMAAMSVSLVGMSR